ncbi:MAG: glycosyltransferase [Verrucomicrobiales bacterium]|nr:glycosyltransferase [Verrucomicrobiales bacterium]
MVKIFYIGWTEPGNSSGATLALKRHLYEGIAYEVLIATDKPHNGVGSADNWIYLRQPQLFRRLSRTRFRFLVAQYEMLIEPYVFLAQVWRNLQRFRPDVVLTIPDNSISWCAYLVARQAGLPLVTNFQDWWPRGQFWAWFEAPWKPFLPILENRLLRMHDHSKVAFYTSDGFRRFLPQHPDSPRLFPCPSSNTEAPPVPEALTDGHPIRLIYGGTLIGYYGRKLLELAKACVSNPNVELRLFGGIPDWSSEDLAWANATGIYQGSLTHDAYRAELRSGDAFLTVMSNAPELHIMMSTSFTTKFLEYCQFGRPVIVWGPEYCEPVIVARATDAGLAVTNEDPTAVIIALESLRDPAVQSRFVTGARAAAGTFFDPSAIQQIFEDGISRAVDATT